MTQDDTKRAPWEAWLELRHHQAPRIHRSRPEGELDKAFVHVIEKSAFDLVLNTLKQIFDATRCDDWPRPLIMNVTNQLGLDMDWKPK